MSSSLPILTHSSLSAMKACPKRYYYSYVMGIEKDRPSDALRFGSSVHVGLDALAQGKILDVVCEEIRTMYAEYPAWCNDEELMNAWDIERETVLRMLSGYVWYWGDHEKDADAIEATEHEFQILLRNPQTNYASRVFHLAGKIDKLVRRENGDIVIREHKTTSDSIEPDSDYWRRLTLDQQISMYVNAARRLGYEVNTVQYDVIRKPSIAPSIVADRDENNNKIVVDELGERVFKSNGEPRQTGDTKKGYTLQSHRETPEEFGTRLTEDIVSRPEFYYARRDIPRLEADLDEFRRELWIMKDLILLCRRLESWPRNTDSCLKPYRCEFTDICFDGLDPDHAPGYRQKEHFHPELQKGKIDHASDRNIETAAQPTD